MTKRISAEERAELERRLIIDNPWWVKGQIPKFYSDMSPRPMIDAFSAAVEAKDIKRAPILMGPRRVGKTVLLYHCIQKLLSQGVESKKIVYMSLDTPIYGGIGLEILLHIASETSGCDIEGMYIFFDEIQYLQNWEQHLKSLIDTYHNTKFIGSGSAAAALKMKSRESGAGRFTDFILPPLSFAEFLEMSGKGNLVESVDVADSWLKYSTCNLDELNLAFMEYLNIGGYPEVLFSMQQRKELHRYIKDDIVEKVLLRDLPSLYGIGDTQELNRFFAHIAFRSGDEFSYQNLSEDSGISKDTVKKYITYLEAAYLIKVVNRLDQNAKRFQRTTTFKIYLTSPILRNALFSAIKEGDDMFGAMVETALIDQWLMSEEDGPYYANWHQGRQKGEVDMVWVDAMQKAKEVVEVKWSDRFAHDSRELKSLKAFISVNPSVKTIIVTTKSVTKIEATEFGNINFIPSSLYAYQISKGFIDAGR